ncbi:MAG: 50S ribosomal protein L18e [Nanoarchaeota archaeon]|nr:50S ribosomal protein L18e [Nanoarchaeota archaeon]
MIKKVLLSKTKIKKDLKKKTNPELVNIIDLARKQKAWLPLAKILAGPTKNYADYNLKDLNEKVSAGDTALIPGKILSGGDLDKKVKLCALSFSKSAADKLKKAKIEFCTISDEIKNNPDAKGIKIIK